MKVINELTTFTKATLGLGVLLLTYGLLSRLIPINFFWEATSVGWGFIYLGLIGLLFNGIKLRKEKKKKTILNKLVIGFISFIFLLQITLCLVLPNTDAYKTANEYVLNNEEIISEIGNITGFGFIPTGEITVKVDSKGKTGNANINFIIKGEKAYKSVTVYVTKAAQSKWEVYEIE